MKFRALVTLACLAATGANATELPFLDSDTEYSATRVIETSEGSFEQKVNWTPDKVRTETSIEGVVLLNIVRKDLGIMWISNPALGRCIQQPVEGDDEMTQLGGQYESEEVAYQAVGKEEIDGRAVTKYEVVAEDFEAGPNRALMWTTDQNILVRMEMLPPADMPELRFTMRLADLETGPQDAALFESPGNCVDISDPTQR